MASPQIEHGYTRIANELLEKLHQISIGGGRIRILLWLVRNTYGYGKKETPLNIPEISRGVGFDRSNCRRTLRELVDLNVVSQRPHNGTQVIGINKDWSEWKTRSQRLHGVIMTSLMVSQRPRDYIIKYKRNNPIGPFKKKGRKTNVPEEFLIDAERKKWIVKNLGQIPKEIIVRERDKFLDRNRAIAKQYTNWNAAWQNWLRTWFFQYGGKEEVFGKPDKKADEQKRRDEAFEHSFGDSDGEN